MAKKNGYIHLALVGFISIVLIIIVMVVWSKFGLKGVDILFSLLFIPVALFLIYFLIKLIKLWIHSLKN